MLAVDAPYTNDAAQVAHAGWVPLESSTPDQDCKNGAEPQEGAHADDVSEHAAEPGNSGEFASGMLPTLLGVGGAATFVLVAIGALAALISMPTTAGHGHLQEQFAPGLVDVAKQDLVIAASSTANGSLTISSVTMRFAVGTLQSGDVMLRADAKVLPGMRVPVTDGADELSKLEEARAHVAQLLSEAKTVTFERAADDYVLSVAGHSLTVSRCWLWAPCTTVARFFTQHVDMLCKVSAIWAAWVICDFAFYMEEESVKHGVVPLSYYRPPFLMAELPVVVYACSMLYFVTFGCCMPLRQSAYARGSAIAAGSYADLCCFSEVPKNSSVGRCVRSVDAALGPEQRSAGICSGGCVAQACFCMYVLPYMTSYWCGSYVEFQTQKAWFFGNSVVKKADKSTLANLRAAGASNKNLRDAHCEAASLKTTELADHMAAFARAPNGARSAKEKEIGGAVPSMASYGQTPEPAQIGKPSMPLHGGGELPKMPDVDPMYRSQTCCGVC